MWSQDFMRVLQGAGKVAEQAARLQAPAVGAKSAQLARHAAELSRLAPLMLQTVEHAASGAAAAVASQAQSMQAAQWAESKPASAAPDAAAAASGESSAIRTATAEPTRPPAPVRSTLPPEEAFTAPGAVKVEEKREEPVEEKPQVAPQVTEKAQPSVEETMKANAAHEFAPEPSQPVAEEDAPRREWQERHVPSSPISRILGFGSLAAKLAVGTATEIVRRGGKGGTYNALVSDRNAEKLAETLCTMRGAALKLGQMLSIQDENMVPPQLAMALDRVRQNAHVMPKAQLHQQLAKELGEDWRDRFLEFDDVPIAAASIGQVHRGTLKSGERVAIKIQYPGVAESIESDLLNLKRIVTYTNILPRGLYIDEIIRVGQQELTDECNYLLEADNQERFNTLVRASGLSESCVVPRVYRELSTARVLTTELISGVAVDKVVHLSQDVRNRIARRILELTIHELFDWRFMQTDPNWSNFMYNASTDTIGLVDFGAAREYPKAFVDDYFQIVWGAANGDRRTMMNYSLKLKFLTGDESPAMLRAHEAAGMVVGEPFRSSEPFDFHRSELTKRLAQHTEVFMHGRLTPPPQEVYSLHRKLAGAFLMCIKLRAVVPCRDVLEQVHAKYYAK